MDNESTISWKGVRKDCFAYNHRNKDCKALLELVCRRKKCRFYKSVFDYEIPEPIKSAEQYKKP